MRAQAAGRRISRTFIRELKVVGGIPSNRAAPLSPEMRQPQVSSARMMFDSLELLQLAQR